MLDKIKIPTAMQIRVDDVGWHNGRDERHINRPSRSGLPRMHHPNDFAVLNEIGKELGIKINCPLVLAEWDIKNRLRGVPHVTYDVEGWDRASEIDMDFAEKSFLALEESQYIDYAIHGLLHGYYHNGELVNEKQYYPLRFDEKTGCHIPGKFSKLPLDEFRLHLDLFFEIYNDWGFKKEIHSFSSPCGCVGTPEENSDYARVLRDEYGILYWPNGWADLDKSVDVSEGIVCAKGVCLLPWDAYDVDPSYVELAGAVKPIRTDFGFHQTNFIRYNPEKNLEYVPLWVDFFRRQTEMFGTMLSKNDIMGASQGIYANFAKTEVSEGKYIIDFSEVDKKKALCLQNEFYISIKNDLTPEKIEGGVLELYESKKEFRTYKITRNGENKVAIEIN